REPPSMRSASPLLAISWRAVFYAMIHRRCSACAFRLTTGLALLLVVSGCAATGSIQGRVLVSGKVARADARASRAGATPPPTTKTTRTALMDAVIYIEERPPKPVEKRTFPPTVPPPEDPPPPPAQVSQRDHCFIPHVLAIETGTTVQFENRDVVYHN